MSELPQSWCHANFEDAFTVISDQGKRLPESEYKAEGTLPVIDQGEKEIGGYTDDNELACNGPFPLILFGDHTRRIKLVDHTFVVGAQGVKLLSPTAVFNPKFLFYQIPILDLPDRGYSRHFQFVRNLQFIAAPEPEQTKIVAEIEKQFTRLDDAVAALKRVQANLKRYRASVLKAACEGRLAPTEADLARKESRSYEPASELLKRILAERRAKWEADQLQKMIAAGKAPKDDEWKKKYKEASGPDTTNLPAVPEGWAFASLEQITSAARPICYGILMPKENIANGVLYVRVKDMKGDIIDLNALYRTTPEIAADYARASLKTGDLLLAIRGTYGRVADVPPELEGGNITQDTARLAVSKLINHHYIAGSLRSDDTQKFFKRVARGVAVRGVNIADVRVTPILLPPRCEQDRIVAQIDRNISFIDDVISTNAIALERSSRLRRAILAEAFSGNLVPQDPNDEPASVLLERIRAERAALTTSNGNHKTTTNAETDDKQRRTRIAKLAHPVRGGKRLKNERAP